LMLSIFTNAENLTIIEILEFRRF